MQIPRNEQMNKIPELLDKEGGPSEEDLPFWAIGEAAAAQKTWVGSAPAQEPKSTSQIWWCPCVALR